MDYDEAIRLYGIDKPDLRLPAFTDVRDCFTAENLQELAINANLPVIAIRTPKVGELSRKERDDIKPMFHAKGGARVYEDFKRIGNKYPDAAAAIAKKTAMEDGDLIVLVAGSAQAGPQTAMPSHRKVTPAELAIYASAGLLRLALAQNMPTGTASSRRPAIRRRITASCGSPTSPCLSGTRARSSGWRRIIPSPRRTNRTWPARSRESSRSTIRSRR